MRINVHNQHIDIVPNADGKSVIVRVSDEDAPATVAMHPMTAMRLADALYQAAAKARGQLDMPYFYEGTGRVAWRGCTFHIKEETSGPVIVYEATGIVELQ